MANIKAKSLNELKTWNVKELRKLRMTLKNRIESFKASAKPKDLASSHLLYDYSLEQCQELLEKVLNTEKEL